MQCFLDGSPQKEPKRGLFLTVLPLKVLYPPHPFVKWFMKLFYKKDNGYKRSEIDMRYIKKYILFFANNLFDRPVLYKTRIFYGYFACFIWFKSIQVIFFVCFKCFKHFQRWHLLKIYHIDEWTEKRMCIMHIQNLLIFARQALRQCGIQRSCRST